MDIPNTSVQSLFSRGPGDPVQELFQKLKPVCVPLLAHSRLDPRNIPRILSLLSDLIACLDNAHATSVEIPPSLCSYAFVPISTILTRNEPSAVPDQVMERLLFVTERLFREWWWSCDVSLWAQMFMLASSILGSGGDVSGRGKGKARVRDDETKDAAVCLLYSLVRDRSDDMDVQASLGDRSPESALARLAALVAHVQTPKLVPVVGNTLDTLLATAGSAHLPLQRNSLSALEVLISAYLPDAVVSTVLPGVVSTSVRVALGQTRDSGSGNGNERKGWASGEVAEKALRVIVAAVVRAVGDEVCLRAGLVHEAESLDDLVSLASEGLAEATLTSEPSRDPTMAPYATARTPSWLRATESQLLVALNSLAPLVSHPTPNALSALGSLSSSLLSSTRLTLPSLRPLLLSFILSAAASSFPHPRTRAQRALIALLSPPSKGRHEFAQALMQTTADGLSALPRLLPSRADAKIKLIASQVEATCTLPFVLVPASKDPASGMSSSIRAGVAALLGPTGHVEKWGWRLLSALLFSPPSASPIASSLVDPARALEGPGEDQVVFPHAQLACVEERETQAALERMLCAMGRAGGEDCVVAVEWFVGVGIGDGGATAEGVAAFWCASQILQGVAGVSLDGDETGAGLTEHTRPGRRLEKFARWLVRLVSELWNHEGENYGDFSAISTQATQAQGRAALGEGADDGDDARHLVEFSKGLTKLLPQYDIKTGPSPRLSAEQAEILHKAFSLQLLCVSAAVLRARFGPLLQHALYPLLLSLVSPSPHLSHSARSALQHITGSLGYASPANLLLSNFDYALDGVARRLTRRWLDVDAPKVLVELVRLVGRDVVQRAGDVVEECFDRLDDFHGYQIVVEGLVEALFEVVRVVQEEEPPPPRDVRYAEPVDESASIPDGKKFELFLEWVKHRHDPKVEDEEDFGPAPREAWGKDKGKETTVEDEQLDETQLKQDDPFAEPPVTPTQALTQQIVSRSIHFLTHGSPAIRARILALLAAAVPVLSSSSLLPSVHRAWPYVLNRLADNETYVVASAAALVAALATHVGRFMSPRVWGDVWPRFRTLLRRLEEADAQSALARRSAATGGVGTESVYTHSHRLYRAMLRTMTASAGAAVRDKEAWEVLLAFRRFLHKWAHEELQEAARELYVAYGKGSTDRVWLVLISTDVPDGRWEGKRLLHLRQTRWDVHENVERIFRELGDS